MPDALGQPDPMPTDALQNLTPSTSCLSQLEVGSTPQHRSSSWGAPLAGAQSYSLHALEDLYHTPGYPTPSLPSTCVDQSLSLPSGVVPEETQA